MSVRGTNSNSQAIRQEIQRFESVHPSIYAIYDLIELLPDTLIAHQIREHVVNIEDSFVNSQEWTLSRHVPDLRLGIVGAVSSGKSALVHRYLTGSYMQEESPEGGRFKKEIQLDGQSYLLLIRDEGGPPEFQFTMWVDAVMFVFSLESEASFTAIYSYYAKMAQYRNAHEVPMMLVGTQDAISESSPRVIDDARARQLARDLHCAGYYETCATYGLAVQQVFTDACQKMVACRGASGSASTSRPTTPIRHHTLLHSSPSPLHQKMHTLSVSTIPNSQRQADLTPSPMTSSTTTYNATAVTPVENNNVKLGTAEITPSSTPTTSRKSRRRSNLFTSSRKNDKAENEHRKKENGELGSGRAIPLKQGQLYKRSTKSLNKEWKKKYVTLCEHGTLAYYPNLQDYMDDVHGKHIPLQYVTVKVPGQRPRGSHPASNPADVGEDGYLCFPNGSSIHRLDGTSVKKRHRRIKSSGVRTQENDESDGFEFCIVSLDNKQWHFQALCAEERDDWVCSIEQQILASLQAGDVTSQCSTGSGTISTLLRRVLGNGACVDCSFADPDWASLNLGVLVCIECSGIHRNLGSHVSKVRSLQLDEWPPWHVATLLVLGNQLANSIWEYNTRGMGVRPSSTSPREEKERWIRRKYEMKHFLQPISSQPPLSNQLIDAVCRSDLKTIYHVLIHCSTEDVNCQVGPHDTRTPLHLACSLGSVPIAQLLIWHGADVRSRDQDGRACLWYAKANENSTDSTLVDMLSAAGCPDT